MLIKFEKVKNINLDGKKVKQFGCVQVFTGACMCLLMGYFVTMRAESDVLCNIKHRKLFFL